MYRKNKGVEKVFTPGSKEEEGVGRTGREKWEWRIDTETAVTAREMKWMVVIIYWFKDIVFTKKYILNHSPIDFLQF